MNIAFLVRYFPKLSETFILNQITGLIDLGHEVEVFAEAPSGDPDPPEIERYGLRRRTHYFNVPEGLAPRAGRALALLARALRARPAEGPRRERVRRCLRALNVLRFGRYSLKVLYAIQPFLGRRFDVLQCHYGGMGNLGAALKEAGVEGKLAVMFHGTDIREGLERGGAIYRRLFRNADAVLAISAYNERHLLAFGAKPETLIRHPVGIDVSLFEEPKTRRDEQEVAEGPEAENSRKRTQGTQRAGRLLRSLAAVSPSGQDGRARECGPKVRVLTVARLTPVKGVDIGLRAMAELRQRRPARALEYRIVGDGPQRAELEALADRLGLRDVVRFLGALPHAEVARELAEADLYLLPSRAEALPVALMEAQCAGLPAVAARVGSVEEIVEDGQSGVVVPAEDPAAMAGALADLLARPETWAELGRRGRERVTRQYDIRALNRRLTQIYEGLLAGG